MPYHYLEHLSWADTAFEAWAATPESLLIESSRACLQVMVPDLSSVRPRERREIAFHSDSSDLRSALDALLFELLEKQIFFKDAEQLLLLCTQASLKPMESGHELRATLEGEAIDPNRHEFATDVKAVTLHRFHVEGPGASPHKSREENWKATVVLDV